MLLVTLNVKKLLKRFTKNNRKKKKKKIQKDIRVEIDIKRKIDKLYLTWKGYDNSFNSWIDKKD